jgi:hypothetical protein
MFAVEPEDKISSRFRVVPLLIKDNQNRMNTWAHCHPLVLSSHTQATLALLVALLLGGLFQIFSQISRFALWGIWLLIWWMAIRACSPARFRALIKPALPFVVWFAVYSIWGAIASPIPVFANVGREFFRLITIMMALAVLTADRDSLQRLSSMTTWVLFLNLLVSIALLKQLPIIQPLVPFLVKGDFAHVGFGSFLDRYSGLWGNANAAGLDTLILLVLSAYGRGLLVWLGRGAGVAIIYLAASRTATYLLLLVGLLFFYNSLRSNRRVRWIIVGCVVPLAIVWLCGAFLEFKAILPKESAFSRVFDPLETKTEFRGGITRLGIIETWLPVLKRNLWCGQGYAAMGGSSSNNLDSVHRTDIPFMGVHNMYLGTWIDGGFFGGISFMLLLGFGLTAALRARLASNDQIIVSALWLVAVIFGAFSHNLQASLDGQALYLLCFILPRTLALSYTATSQKQSLQPGHGNGSSHMGPNSYIESSHDR